MRGREAQHFMLFLLVCFLGTNIYMFAQTVTQRSGKRSIKVLYNKCSKVKAYCIMLIWIIGLIVCPAYANICTSPAPNRAAKIFTKCLLNTKLRSHLLWSHSIHVIPAHYTMAIDIEVTSVSSMSMTTAHTSMLQCNYQ